MCEEVMETMGWLFGWSSPEPTYLQAQCGIHGLFWLTQLFTDSVVNVKCVFYFIEFFTIDVMGVDPTAYVCTYVYGTLLILGIVAPCVATSDTSPCIIWASTCQ